MHNQSSNSQDSSSSINHIYYEVGSELLSKPTALCDLVELYGQGGVVIFCNSPSDTDLVEVMLKKRGLRSKKLVGHVPPHRVHESRLALINHDVHCLIVTDVAARGVEFDDIALVLNYSLPDDPEVYLHRTAAHIESASAESTEEAADAPKKELLNKERFVASLISPLDIGNFHYLKKISNLPFSKAELPKGSDLIGIRLDSLRKEAVTKAYLNDERLKIATEALCTGAERDQIIALLLHNTLDVIPNLNATLERASNEDRDRDDGRRDEGRRGDVQEFRRPEGRPEGRGRDRDPRRGGGRSSRDGVPSRDGDRSNGGFNERGGNGNRRNDRGPQESQGFNDSNEGGSDEGDSRQHGRRPRGEPSQPPVRDYRIYIGHGLRTGITEEKLREVLTTSCGLPSDQVKRFIVREAYAFVDVPEEAAEGVVEKLATTELGAGQTYFARKAITINAPREARPAHNPDEGYDEQSAQDSEQEDSGQPEESTQDREF
jgi:superfamily II DNA/RNA helicase